MTPERIVATVGNSYYGRGDWVEMLDEIERLRELVKEGHEILHYRSDDHSGEHLSCSCHKWEYAEPTWELSGVGRNVTGPAEHAAHVEAILNGGAK